MIEVEAGRQIRRQPSSRGQRARVRGSPFRSPVLLAYNTHVWTVCRHCIRQDPGADAGRRWRCRNMVTLYSTVWIQVFLKRI